MQESKDGTSITPLSGWDDENCEIDVERVGKVLEWLETVYLHSQQTSYWPAFTALCMIMVTVRAFAESYLQHPQIKAVYPSECVLAGEVYLRCANSALEALFSLVKPASEVGFDPKDLLCTWAGVDYNKGISPDS